jgi:hypothetical protein
MGTLLAAFAAFVLSTLDLLPLPPDALPQEFVDNRELMVMALLLYIVAATLVRRHRERPARKPEATAAAPLPETEPAATPPAPAPEPPQAGEALVLLSLLQEKGRFLDFVMEDITAFQDAQVAAASRVVHQGCSAVIREHLDISPVHAGKEGDRITVDTVAEPDRYRLVGKILGQPPFSGVVIHRGWKTSRMSLPRFTRPVDATGPNTITPVEVEVR